MVFWKYLKVFKIGIFLNNSISGLALILRSCVHVKRLLFYENNFCIKLKEGLLLSSTFVFNLIALNAHIYKQL